MKQVKQLQLLSWRGCSFVGATLYSLCVQWFWWESWIWHEDRSHLFSSCTSILHRACFHITLEGLGAGKERLGPEPEWAPGLPLLSGTTTTLSGPGLGPQVPEIEALRSRSELAQVWAFTLPTSALWLRWAVLEQEGPVWAPSVWPGAGCNSLAAEFRLLLMCCLCKCP